MFIKTAAYFAKAHQGNYGDVVLVDENLPWLAVALYVQEQEDQRSKSSGQPLENETENVSAIQSEQEGVTPSDSGESTVGEFKPLPGQVEIQDDLVKAETQGEYTDELLLALTQQWLSYMAIDGHSVFLSTTPFGNEGLVTSTPRDLGIPPFPPAEFKIFLPPPVGEFIEEGVPLVPRHSCGGDVCDPIIPPRTAVPDQVAANIFVTTHNDVIDNNDGVLSLREAIIQANSSKGTDVIQLSDGVYDIDIPIGKGKDATFGDFDITDNLIIQGAGMGITFIDANQLDRIFEIYPNITVTIRDCTLMDGLSVGADGGAIYVNKSNLILYDVAFIDNHTEQNADGGALAIVGDGTVFVVNSQFINNSTERDGGAIFYDGSKDGTGTLAILHTFISENTTERNGGGIYVQDIDNVIIENSFIHANSTISGEAPLGGDGGGGLYADNSTVLISGTSIVCNEAFNGGGIDSKDSSITIINSTIAENLADAGKGNPGSGRGGGIFSEDSEYNIINSTISGNTASRGGAIYVEVGSDINILNSTITDNESQNVGLTGAIDSASASTVTLQSSIVSGNVDDKDLQGKTFVSNGYNLLGDDVTTDSDIILQPTDILSSDPGLEPLAMNGGLTFTHALSADSLAIDNGSNPLNLSTDQTGFDREVQDGQPDIGAFEYGLVPITAPDDCYELLLPYSNVFFIAINDFATTTESSSVTVNTPGVLDNDIAQDPNAVLLVTQINGSSANLGSQIVLASGALVTLNPDGSLVYDPNGQFEWVGEGRTGIDTFQYQATDGLGNFSTAIVQIIIEGENDPVTAVDDEYETDEITVLNIAAAGVLGNDYDIDVGDVLSVTKVEGSPGKVDNQFKLASGALLLIGADGHLIYDPNGAFAALSAGQQTTDSFTYVVGDGFGSTDTATVTVTINGANDILKANDDFYNVQESKSLNINKGSGVLANDNDADVGDVITVVQINGSSVDVGTQITLASGALVTLKSDGSLDYDTNNAFESLGLNKTTIDSFTYQATDGNGSFSTATVYITVTGENDPVDGINDTGTTNEDTKLTVLANGVLSNDLDIDVTDVLIVSAVEGKAANVGVATTLSSGAIVTLSSNGGYVYDPNGKFNSLSVGKSATDSFQYTVSDQNGSTDKATVTITVTGVNDNPTANDDSLSYKASKSSISANLISGTNGATADTDPDSSDILIVSAVNGSAANVGTKVTVTNADYTLSSTGALTFNSTTKGTYNFNYTISDQQGGTSTANVTVTVTPIVLDLNGDKLLSLTSSHHSQVTLNQFDGSLGHEKMGWVGPEDGLLIFDFQQDGKVTSMGEFAFSLYSPEAKTDLDGLRLAFDSNHDLIFDEKDDLFSQFGVWQDKNGNGITDDGEYFTLAQLGITSLSLQSDNILQSIAGNTVYGSTSYQTADGQSHLAGDVGLEVLPSAKAAAVELPDVIVDNQSLDFSALSPHPEDPLSSTADDHPSEQVGSPPDQGPPQDLASLNQGFFDPFEENHGLTLAQEKVVDVDPPACDAACGGAQATVSLPSDASTAAVIAITVSMDIHNTMQQLAQDHPNPETPS